MKRPSIDLAAIDRELDDLGQPRPDIASLVARYAAMRRDSDLPSSLPPEARQQEPSDPPASAPASHHHRSDAPAWSAAASGALTSQELSDDHDEFELLVEDAELSEFDDDQFDSA